MVVGRLSGRWLCINQPG